MGNNGMTQMDVVRSLRLLPLPMPENLAQVFQLLGLYDPREGLEHLLNRVQSDNVRPRQIYNAVLLRVPDGVNMAMPPKNYDARRHLRAALESPEFQRRAMRNFLHNFSSKQRDIFIHIPKCAGTDLILNLAPGRLSFPRVLDFEEWVSKEELFSSLSGLIQAAPFYDRVFVYGHMQVGEYFDIAGARTTDRMFTVIRDPVDLLLSQANYAVGRLRQDPERNDPDTRATADLLGIGKFEATPTPRELKELAVRCLLNRRIAQPNRICYYLGKEQNQSYRRAIEHIVTFDIEITETSNYRRWLDERWGIQVTSRHNESEKLLTTQEARRFFPEQVDAATGEDQKLFNVIKWVLQQTGSASTTGREIAEIAGPDLLTTLPERIASDGHPRRPSVLVVHSAELVDQFQAPMPVDLTDVKATIIAQYLLREGGNGWEVTLSGWAAPEPNFTWTSADEAVIELPTPKIVDDYILRIECSPFVAEGRHDAQRLVIEANGQEIGSARLKEFALLECSLPWSFFADREKLRVVLKLPDAIQPSLLGLSDDERMLGLAVKAVTLVRYSVNPEADDAVKHEQTELDLQKLALQFESLGENCEFGLVQRRFGAEPLGLLRFSSTPLPKLLDALRSKFKGLGNPRNIEVQEDSNGREYMVLDKRFGFLYHAWVKVGEQKPEDIAVRETRRLPLLIRKLTEDLTLGEKTFVFHGMRPLSLEEARELSAVLRQYGPTTLLWVELADDAHAPGSVERIDAGLIKGYMDRFAPGENAHDLSLNCWITLCRNAYRLR